MFWVCSACLRLPDLRDQILIKGLDLKRLRIKWNEFIK